jgi:hypothetical protein
VASAVVGADLEKCLNCDSNLLKVTKLVSEVEAVARIISRRKSLDHITVFL